MLVKHTKHRRTAKTSLTVSFVHSACSTSEDLLNTESRRTDTFCHCSLSCPPSKRPSTTQLPHSAERSSHASLEVSHDQFVEYKTADCIIRQAPLSDLSALGYCQIVSVAERPCSSVQVSSTLLRRSADSL